MKLQPLFVLPLALAWTGSVGLADTTTDRLTGTLRSVGSNGSGNAAAQNALRELARLQGGAIPSILQAMDGASEYSLNWLRSGVETIAQNEISAGRNLPIQPLRQFIEDTAHNPLARRLAYDLIARTQPKTAKEMLPGFLNDPANELRRDAVQLVAEDAAARVKSGDKTSAISRYREALSAARDSDQIESLAKTLTELGEKVDLQKTFGWLTRWKVIGPFSNSKRAGFDTTYPPETSIDFAGELEGLSGKIRWQDYESKSDFGLVDFNQPFTPLKEVTAYAVADFESLGDRPAELRLGCKNGWKVWVNGKLLFSRDEYHRGMEIDQYKIPIQLQSGKNRILVKCCQNEQKEDWTKEWEFQLRITDGSGTPVASK